jgi:hypothetical protein
MPSRQDILIYAAAVLGDGAWLFAAIAAIGFLSGQGGSPFAWPAVFVLLTTAVIATRAIMAIPLPRPDPAVVQTGLGVLAAYTAVAFSPTASANGFELFWAWRFAAGNYDARTAIGIGVGIFAAIYIWRHGMLLASADLSESRLHRSFRFGVLALTLALLIEQGSGRDLGVSAMLLPFFAGSLPALAMARMRRNTALGGAWIRVIGATVVGVVGVGLALAYFGGPVVQGTATMAVRGWAYVVDGVLWVLRLILEPVAWAISAAIEWLLAVIPRGGALPPLRVPGTRWWERLGLEATTPDEAIGNILQYPILILILGVVCWILLRAYRQTAMRQRQAATEYREPLTGDATADLARMLGAMLPSWLRPKYESEARWPHDPSIVDAFRLYYDTLGLAAERGSGFNPYRTPIERIPQLARALPGVPVDRITACFVAACYGHKRIDAAEAAALRTAIDHAKMTAP